jgi:polysaccharide export outer membrane protein
VGPLPTILRTLPAPRLVIALSALGVLASCAPALNYAPAPSIPLERPSLDLARDVSAKLEDHFALNGDFHPNDLIRLSFPYAPLLTSDQRVQLSGLQARLTTLYRPKLKQPSVAISVLEYNRPPPLPEIFVLGEVMKPGNYPYREGISLYEGLARSGGGNRDADLSRVVLLQPVDDHLVARMVDLRAVLTGDANSLGYLSPFSILIVPPTKIARDVDRARQIRQIIGFNGITVGSAVTLLH